MVGEGANGAVPKDGDGYTIRRGNHIRPRFLLWDGPSTWCKRIPWCTPNFTSILILIYLGFLIMSPSFIFLTVTNSNLCLCGLFYCVAGDLVTFRFCGYFSIGFSDLVALQAYIEFDWVRNSLKCST